MRVRHPVIAAAVVLATACGSSSDDADPEPSWASLELARPTDENPDPSVLEVRLEAGEATKTYPGAAPAKVWAYNGSVPGPLLDAKVGDRIVVHFTNRLPEPTTIHWHGLRLPATMDGTPAMQTPVPPGGTFEYAFTLKDAGLFWFHPHVRGDIQVRKGLYGAIRVRGANEPVVDHEAILVLDDITVQPDGTISDYLDDASAMMGREGKTLLVNGQSQPTLPVRAGGIERWRIVNVANGRFFNLAIPGVRWRVIGTDGGFLPHPYETEHLLVAPGERYDVVFVASGAPGSEIELVNDPYERGHNSGTRAPMPVGKLRITKDAPLSGRVLPDAFPAIERLSRDPIDHTFTLNEGMIGGELKFTVNGAVFPDVPLVDIAAGSVQTMLVENVTEMDHPFHVHGTFFQVLETNGTPIAPDRLANKDTIIVPMKSKLKLVARFDEPGKWMYHCHILEHAEGGMMGVIAVQ